jgi:hypothetical protein
VIWGALGIRREDRRDASVGFLILLLVMAGHSILEAARDALFLASLPPTLLPWAYLTMAVLTVLGARLNWGAGPNVSRTRALSLSLLIGAGGTACFSFLSSLRNSASSLVAFYVWTGLIVTVVVVQFWVQLSDVLHIGQAKRVYAWIAAGGLVGATLGSGIASALLLVSSARSLPLAAALIYGSAAFLPFLFTKKPRVSRPPRRGDEAPTKLSELAMLRGDAYLRRLLLLVLTSTVVVTGLDYVFKAVVHENVPAQELGTFFAHYYGLLNFLALLVQVALAPRLVRATGVNRALLFMPLLLLLTSVGFVLSGGLAAVLLLKGSDGILRHSVNRTGTEILYVPLSSNVRERFKAFAEAVGQRGGQALTSFLILGANAFGVQPQGLGWALLAFTAAWLLCILGLETHYLDLFRNYLRQGTIETSGDVPELDLRTLEALVATLSSEDDAEVIAALDMFTTYERSNLVPALILYHPSRNVVLRAFELFTDSPRPDLTAVAGRLLGHPDHDIRAAALRFFMMRRPAESLLRRRLEDSSATVRATALVGLTAAGHLPPAQAEVQIRRIIAGPSDEARLALALALRVLPPEHFAWVATELLAVNHSGLAASIAHSLAAAPDVRYIPLLIDLLAKRDARADARAALVRLGTHALDVLERQLYDERLPRALRRHLPRTISKFPGTRAATILATALARERDDAVQFKILRGLGRMRHDDPALRIDEGPVLDSTDTVLKRALTLLWYRAVLDEAQKPASEGAELLSACLRDQERHATEVVFRLLHTLKPEEEFAIIYDGFRSNDPKVRAGSRELLAHGIPESLRPGVLALVEETSPRDRLKRAVEYYQPPDHERWEGALAALADGEDPAAAQRELDAIERAALAAMTTDDDVIVRSIATYYVGIENITLRAPATLTFEAAEANPAVALEPEVS